MTELSEIIYKVVSGEISNSVHYAFLAKDSPTGMI